MNDSIEDNPLVQAEVIRGVWDTQVKQYMGDHDFNKALDLVIKIIANPNIPPQQVAPLCTQLEAYAIKFRMLYVGHMSYLKGTTEANMKKNHYKELYIGLDKLVDSLKYLAR